MINEGVVLGHEISQARIEVDKAKNEVIEKLPLPQLLKVLEVYRVMLFGFY